MNDEFVSKTIEMVQGQILALEQQTAEKKRTVNNLCVAIGRPPVYAITEPNPGASVGIRSDEFYGRPLASAARSVLEKRAASSLGAAPLDEIYAGMLQGGFRFEAKNDATAKRSLAISLSKNTVTFHRLPNGNIGLSEWYPEARTKNGDKEDRSTANKEAKRTAAKTTTTKRNKSKNDRTELSEPYPNEFADGSDEVHVPDASNPEKGRRQANK